MWVTNFLTISGEDEFSYGFDGRGLKAENGQFEEFGQTFGENDVIGCFAVSAPDSCGLTARSGQRAPGAHCASHPLLSFVCLVRCVLSCVVPQSLSFVLCLFFVCKIKSLTRSASNPVSP